MEYAQTILHIATQLGLTPLNLVLIVMLYFMGAQSGIFPKFWKSESVKTAELPATRAQMDKLSSYYNHDTTEILRSIDSGVKNVHEAVEKLEEVVSELKNNHHEWEKYGIPVRTKQT
jgi:hypothetical protein